MSTISAIERSLYHAAIEGTTTLAAGVTEVGNTTHSGYTLLSTADEPAFLAAVAGKAGAYNPLPDVGEWLEAGAIYGYAGGLVIVRQSHARTSYAPEDTPALFSVYREDATDALGWVANERVEVGMRRTDEGLTYQCLQSHVTQVDWRPSVTPALWKLVEDESDCPEFVQPTGAHDAYNIGDCVTFEGQQYVSKINANVWSPAVYPAGWELLGPA